MNVPAEKAGSKSTGESQARCAPGANHPATDADREDARNKYLASFAVSSAARIIMRRLFIALRVVLYYARLAHGRETSID